MKFMLYYRRVSVVCLQNTVVKFYQAIRLTSDMSYARRLFMHELKGHGKEVYNIKKQEIRFSSRRLYERGDQT